ncbi:TM2 domain-containing protein [Lutibacter sp.]|nr:TM2 domain-containing protein [Lutibacter sp.]MCF6166940.1 TM2 domain-containing protein [Lutibacter sp.]
MDVLDENGNIIPKNNEDSKRVIAGILAIVLGPFGVHKFILGYTTQGIILLAVTIVTCGIGAAVTSIIGLIEGVIYLTKSDEEFIQMYQINKKEWF